MENKQQNIFEKLSAITHELTGVRKNLEVQIGNGKYKAVGELDVLKAVRPLEEKYRVYSYPYSREIVESGTLESLDSKGNVKKQLFERIKVVYRFVNLDNPSDLVDIVSYGDGIDNGDKSVGKAMTYADKYALLKAYKIMTGDDPDQFASEDLKEIKAKQPLDRGLVERCSDLNINLQKLAVYFKKDVNDLTDDDLAKAIEQKEKALNKAGK